MAPDPRSRILRARPAAAPRATGWHEAAIVWLPWLAAPLFFALPIGGCGVGERLRHAAARPMPTDPAAGAGVTLVTFDRP